MIFFWLQAVVSLLLLPCVAGFSAGNTGGGGKPPRKPPTPHGAKRGDFEEPASEPCLWMAPVTPNDEERLENDHDVLLLKKTSKPNSRLVLKKCHRGGDGNAVVQGTKATLSTSANFWSRALTSVGSTVTAPFRACSRAVSSMFRSKEKFLEEKLIQELSTMPVEAIEVKVVTGQTAHQGTSNNGTTTTTSSTPTVLPPQVVQLAARRAGMIGQPLKPESVQEFARALKRWYMRQGYVLHGMTGATLRPETATAEIQLQEPTVSAHPVDIVFCKELIVDQESGELLTKRQYQDRHLTRRSKGFRKKVSLQGVNTTLVSTSGRTRATKIASALKLEPGTSFKWDSHRWRSIANSGVFSRVISASPQPMEDGSVQMVIVAQEALPQRMEYGLGRSGYTGVWEGELDFEHGNLFGGGESVGISVSRGARNVDPSIRLRFSDDNFGLDGGYEVEAFRDALSDEKGQHHPVLGKALVIAKKKDNKPNPQGDAAAAATTQQQQDPFDYEHDILVDRRGATFRLRNPLDVGVVENSAASCSFERTSTKTGLHENIGSCTLSLGPFYRQLPLDARSGVDAKITTGTRVQQSRRLRMQRGGADSTTGGRATDSGDDFFLDRFELRPYATASATARQTFPLISTSTKGKRPVVLALRHSLTTSTPNLPRHEATAQGIANLIRDSTENGKIATALRGTTELRLPVDIPRIQTLQDGKIVLFGDWLLATPPDLNTPIYRKSCIGVGLRKSVQGIPVRYDLCYTWEGKLKGCIGLGKDFEA